MTNGQVGFLSGAIILGSGFVALAIGSNSETEIGLMALIFGIGTWLVVGVVKLIKS